MLPDSLINRRRRRAPYGARWGGINLLEMTTIVALLSILAVVVIPRFPSYGSDAKKRACSVNLANIEVQCQLWLRQKNAAPLGNLSDIGGQSEYFPNGLPTCPVDHSTYMIDTTTLRVIGHAH